MIYSRDGVNKIIKSYKNGKITIDDCIDLISKRFENLYRSKERSLKDKLKIDMGQTWMPDFKSVYMDAIVCSIKNFSFKSHNMDGVNRLSFAPYFQNLFEKRCALYSNLVNKELIMIKKKDSIDEFLDSDSTPDATFEEQHLSVPFEKCLSYKNHLKLENAIKKTLTKREYRIFFLKMKNKSNLFISKKMTIRCSEETIRRNWNVIQDKLKTLLEKRLNAHKDIK